MTYINIVSNLKLHPQKGLVSKDCSGKWVRIHHQQGDLDGACAVYSLMMNLLILGKISEEEISIDSPINKRYNRGKFLSHFLEEQGLIRNGYSYRCLAKEIRDYCSKELCVDAKQKNPQSLENAVKFSDDNITKNDLPIIISVVYQPKKGESELHSHALLAIGIEYNENDIPIKLLCLDPGASSPIYAKWNCFIDTSNNNSQYPYWYVQDGVCHKVVFWDMSLIMTKE